MPLGDDSFDQVSSRAAVAAIHRAIPDATTVVLPTPDKDAFARDDATTEQTEPTADQLQMLRKGAADSGARYLLIVSKVRGDTRLAFRNGPEGQGKLFGLGYYFDKNRRVVQTSTGKSGRGFLSPYAYLAVTLVDLQSGQVVRNKTATDTMSIASAVSDTETHPWDAVPAETKVRALNTLIRRAVSNAIPPVLQPT